MESMQRKRRKRKEGTSMKRQKLAEEHESSFPEEEAIPSKNEEEKRVLMTESIEEPVKTKKPNEPEEKSPEANLSMKRERRKKTKTKKKKKKKEVIGSIAGDDHLSHLSTQEKGRATATDVSFRLLVPSIDLGKVIGKHGSRVQQLREDIGAHIKIGDAIMNLSERLLWISSKEESSESQSAAERALLHVANLLIEPRNEEVEMAKVRLLIAGSQARSLGDETGDVIGKISEKSGASIHVLQKKMFPLLAFASETDRLVQFEGKVSHVLKALELIAARLRGSPLLSLGADKRKNGGAFIASVEIRVPNDLIGKLIGKNGSTIRQIRQQCGVYLEVDDLKEGKKDTTVHLKGTLPQVTMAQTLLQVFLASKQRAK